MLRSAAIRRGADVLIAAALAVAAIALAAFGLAGSAPAAIAGSLFVLVAPGYAAQAALFPGRAPGAGVRCMLALGLSLSFAVVGGFVLNAFPPGLTPTSWAALLGALTVAAGAVAIARRDAASTPASFPRVPHPRNAALWGAAIVIVAAAFVMDVRSAATQPRPGFTQLWLLPAGASVRLGVRNEERGSVTYDLRLQVGGRTVQRWPAITLKPDETWSQTFALPPGTDAKGPIEADLYRGTDTAPYRHAILWPGTRAGP